MKVVNSLLDSTKSTYQWVHHLIDDVTDEHWDIAPDVLNTTVSWQVVHLIRSYYYHTMMAIKGHDKEVLTSIPLKKYMELFKGLPAQEWKGLVDKNIALEQLAFMERKSLETIGSLSDEDLQKPLEPLDFDHPVAKTKWEALNWNIQHTMWHCGQLSMVIRELGQRYDFLKHREEKK